MAGGLKETNKYGLALEIKRKSQIQQTIYNALDNLGSWDYLKPEIIEATKLLNKAANELEKEILEIVHELTFS